LTQTHRQNAIAVDSSGNPHIAYSTDWQLGGGYWDGIVEYARFNGTDWESTTVYSMGEEIRAPISLAPDSQDNPQILYKKRFWGGNFRVHLQAWVSPTWTLTELENSDPNNYSLFPPGAALTIDNNDNSYWTYMWHGQNVGGTLISPSTTLASGEDIGYSDIAVDEDGRLFVVYQKGNTLELAVKPLCEKWITMTLVSVPTWGTSDVSLAVSQDIVHVVYYDDSTERLIHLSIPVAPIIGHLEPLQAPPVAEFNGLTRVRALVQDGIGQPLSNMPVTLTLEPAYDSIFIYPQTGTVVTGVTDDDGAFDATLQTGAEIEIITVTVTAGNLLPQSKAIRLQHTILYLPLIFSENQIREGDEFYVGERSSSLCAEHDSYVLPVATAIEDDTLPEGTQITAQYNIQARHPSVEVHPRGIPMGSAWCDTNFECCQNDQQSGSSATRCNDPIHSADTQSEVFTNGQEVIRVLDGSPDIGTLKVVVNGQDSGQHTGVVFASLWGVNRFPEDGVIYANGFTRWIPKGEDASDQETDACYGTSVVLGPFQINEPFLSDGYSPSPLRHPKIEVINISVGTGPGGTGWTAQMSGTLSSGKEELMEVSWFIERLNIDTIFLHKSSAFLFS
jgi:hypothetical protein